MTERGAIGDGVSNADDEIHDPYSPPPLPPPSPYSESDVEWDDEENVAHGSDVE